MSGLVLPVVKTLPQLVEATWVAITVFVGSKDHVLIAVNSVSESQDSIVGVLSIPPTNMASKFKLSKSVLVIGFAFIGTKTISVLTIPEGPKFAGFSIFLVNELLMYWPSKV